MAALIEATFPDVSVELIGGGRGDFIVVFDGRELWNKRQVGRFPQPEEIVDAIRG